MDYIAHYYKEIAAILSPFIPWLLNRYASSRVKLAQTTRTDTAMHIQETVIDQQGNPTQNDLLVYIADHAIYNVGREPATDVCATFIYEPKHLRIHPAQHYEIKRSENRTVTYVFKTLPPKSSIELMLLSVNVEAPILTSVMSKETTARKIEVHFQERYSKTRLVLVLFVLWIGFAAIAYLTFIICSRIYRLAF